MAGHSKWANIKHRKGRQDAKKGKIFTKIIRELTVAAKHGGAIVADNPRLRLAMDKALAANMSRDTIDRAIARGAGNNEADNMAEITYEGYAPSGVALIVEAMTDNRNRTAAAVRHAFSKYDGNLGTDGSVAYMFERKGQITFNQVQDTESLFEVALEAGADDVEIDESSALITTSFNDFHTVLENLITAGFNPDEAEIELIPNVSNAINELELAQKILRLIDALDDLDDVQNVYHNAEISDAILEQLE